MYKVKTEVEVRARGLKQSLQCYFYNICAICEYMTDNTYL